MFTITSVEKCKFTLAEYTHQYPYIINTELSPIFSITTAFIIFPFEMGKQN